jgi:hypothetical protein
MSPCDVEPFQGFFVHCLKIHIDGISLQGMLVVNCRDALQCISMATINILDIILSNLQ